MTSATSAAPNVATEGLYVYCVARACKGGSVLKAMGLDGNKVHVVVKDTLCAVVHNSQAQPYQSETPEVVQEWVVAHERVIRAAKETFQTVLPMAFDMIVLGGADSSAENNLRNWLGQNHDRFVCLLDKLQGKAEYGVQISWSRRLIADALIQDEPELHNLQTQTATGPKGLAYMLQQKLAKATRAALERQANRYVEQFYDRIRECVEDIRIEKLKKTDDDEQMLLNLSCLMREGSPALGAELDDISKTKGISVRFTGPWPPYSFLGK